MVSLFDFIYDLGHENTLFSILKNGSNFMTAIIFVQVMCTMDVIIPKNPFKRPHVCPLQLRL